MASVSVLPESVPPPGARRPPCPLGPPARNAALKAANPTPPPPVRGAARVGRKDPRALAAAKRLPRSLLSCGRGSSQPAWRTLGGPRGRRAPEGGFPGSGKRRRTEPGESKLSS
ncbi:splicing factor, proline- and glutamine-rich-like [Equus caballus]|uniref:splicing factor, proline- and glutamine-rich-like n=1 Tax=Equus caballus TaxID=9796 RepID=UPI0038B3EE37